MTNNKILIVDDNPEIREVLNVLLSSEGYDVIELKMAKKQLIWLVMISIYIFSIL